MARITTIEKQTRLLIHLKEDTLTKGNSALLSKAILNYNSGVLSTRTILQTVVVCGNVFWETSFWLNFLVNQHHTGFTM